MESSQYEPPVRRSLSDEELTARVNEATASHNGMEAVMELLVAQENLRAQEDAEIEAWVERMEAEGTPQALAALAKFQGRDYIPEPEPIQQVAPEVEQVTEVSVQIIEAEPERPFSWLTTPETEKQIEDSIAVAEALADEVVVEELAPVGQESIEEFEQLLASAAPEEAASALEESSGTAPSNIVVPGDEYRDRKPISQFFGWLGVSSVLTPFLLTFVLVGSGLTAQAIAFDLVIGYLVAGLFIATAGLAGKRSGLSTAVISRAVFGVWGNSIPLGLLVISRLLITTVVISLVVILGDGVSPMLQPFDTVLLSVAGLNLTAGFAVGLVFLTIVLGFTLLRGKVSRISLLVLSSGAALSILAVLVGVSQENLVLLAPGTQGPTSFGSLAAIALIFAVLVITWVAVAPNLSKAVPMKPRGWKVFVSILGAQFVLPLAISLLLLAWIGPAVLVTPAVGELGALSGLVASLPSWSQLVLVVGIGLSLLYMSSLNLKTTALDLLALFRIKSRILSSLLSWFLVALVLLWFVQQPAGRTIEYLVNVFVLAAMLSAGWVGMFVADVGVRKIAYHELSLNRAYGFYGKFNWLSISIWLVTVLASVAIIPVNLMGFGFTGALAPSVGLDDSLGSQSLAITAVVILGALLTVIARIPQIRKQEKEVQSVESRREQLNDIFIGQE